MSRSTYDSSDAAPLSSSAKSPFSTSPLTNWLRSFAKPSAHTACAIDEKRPLLSANDSATTNEDYSGVQGLLESQKLVNTTQWPRWRRLALQFAAATITSGALALALYHVLDPSNWSSRPPPPQHTTPSIPRHDDGSGRGPRGHWRWGDPSRRDHLGNIHCRPKEDSCPDPSHGPSCWEE